MTRLTIFLMAVLMAFSTDIAAQKKSKNKSDDKEFTYSSDLVSGLNVRGIGPALTSGRIADLAVNPSNPFEYYVAVASGGVWKTTNAGTTYEPIFDSHGSYSIGCVSIAPSNEHVVWIGTGENNNQRSVAYGDGVYKSEDGGATFKNTGLKESEHIGNILIHPTDQNTVYVSAYGPLWSEGGERGVYKTTDGGENWELILEISKDTGVSEIAFDPRNPEVIYAAAHQRRRHVYTYIDGGPETALYKTENGGKDWNKLENGLPAGDMGRIGIAVSPANPDVVYAIIKATDGGGFYRSSNRGASFSKMSDYSTSGNYYQEIICDPYDEDKVFSMNTWLHHTEDGGKTFNKTGEKSKHVDNHCIWIDPKNSDHWIVGCDGGLYETHNHATDWAYKPNLPVTQFYRVAVDQAEPFYNVYGGTQDNNTQGGPSRTLNNAGILNQDWIITNGGDGFEPQVDPSNENIVYGQAQYGWLIRYDKKSGQRMGIQPQPRDGEAAYRWNWDAPLLISPHKPERLYFCANKVFKSDNRGDSWEVISEDLSRNEDRNTFKTMDRVWGIDAVMKNKSTTIYGNIVAFDESAKKEGLLYAGTDDGLIHSKDGDGNWAKMSSFPGVPDRTYVNQVLASVHDDNTVFAVFNNHKNGDFKPYVLRSNDKGASWISISGNLPERGSVYSIAQDHVNKDLLFAGTEFGLFFTVNGGEEWTQFTNGIPTVAIRDIALQRRENDVVCASFGRGFFIVDDYTALRELTPELLEKEAHIFTIKEALMYVETNPQGGRGKGSQGESVYTAPNPEFGATFTYYVKEKPETLKEKRQKAEKDIKKEGGDVFYPTKEEIRAEAEEEKPYLLFIVKDDAGNEINKMKTGANKGINRMTWNYRYATTSPVSLKSEEVGRYSSADNGQLALPGIYTVELWQAVNGELTKLAEPAKFNVELLNNTTLPATDKNALLAFQKEVQELRRSVYGAATVIGETEDRLRHIKGAVLQVPGVPLAMMAEVKAIEAEMTKLKYDMYGDYEISKHEFETNKGIESMVGYVIYQLWYTTSAPTDTQRDQITRARKAYTPWLAELKEQIKRVEVLEAKLLELRAPYTPYRGGDWKED